MYSPINYRTALAAAIAGIIGTVLFDIFGFVAMGQWWDIPAALAGALGTGMFIGVLAHYGNGIILAVIFAGLLPLFFGPVWSRALQYITLQTIFGVWLFMLPLMGAGAFGLEMGIMVPIMALVRHWIYAIPLGFLYPKLAAVLDSETQQAEVVPGKKVNLNN